MKQKNFKEIYDVIYEKCGKELEIKRKKSLKKSILAFVIAILIWVGILLVGKTAILPFFIFIFIATIFILIFVISKVTKEYSKSFKEQVVNEIVKQCNPSCRYLYNKGISSKDYIESGFDRGWDRYHSEDFIEGNLEDGSKFRMSEVHTEERRTTTDSDGHTTTTYVTTFLGLYGIINLKTPTKSNFAIMSNSRFAKFNKDRIEMESAEFEKYFDVFSISNNSGIRQSALEIMTPEVIEEFVKLRNLFKTAINVRISLDTIYFRVDLGNIFEAPTFKSSVNFDLLQKYFWIIDFPRMLYEIFIDNILMMYGTQADKEKRNLAKNTEEHKI